MCTFSQCSLLPPNCALQCQWHSSVSSLYILTGVSVDSAIEEGRSKDRRVWHKMFAYWTGVTAPLERSSQPTLEVMFTEYEATQTAHTHTHTLVFKPLLCPALHQQTTGKNV